MDVYFCNPLVLLRNFHFLGCDELQCIGGFRGGCVYLCLMCTFWVCHMGDSIKPVTARRQRSRRWSVGGLQRALLGFVALPLIVVAALGIRFGFDQVNRYQEELLRNDLELVAQVIRIPIGEALSKGDLEAVRVALQSIFTIDRIYGAAVYDVNGDRVASGGIADDDLSHSTIPEQVLLTGEKQEDYRHVAGRVVFSHFLPVFDSIGQIEGFIQITRREDDIAASLHSLTLLSWALWGALTLAILLAVLGGHYGGIGRHVDNLLAAMAKVGKGDTHHRVPINGPREVVAIAEGLNAMLDSIQAAERQLEATRRTEQALQLQLKDQEKMAAVGGMARGFAHELGAPLSVIEGRARRLLRHQWVLPQGEKELEDVRQQVRHLTHTVNQLLEYSRPGPRSTRPFAVNAVLTGMKTVLEPELRHDGPALSVQSETDGDSLVKGDPDRLQLGLLCLVRNALQAARSHVAVTAVCEGDRLRVSVTDDGPGLPDVPVQELVEPFFTTKASGQGTGLGLSIAQTVASEHGGVLELDNLSAGGCRASLVLPVSRETKPLNGTESDV